MIAQALHQDISVVVGAVLLLIFVEPPISCFVYLGVMFALRWSCLVDYAYFPILFLFVRFFVSRNVFLSHGLGYFSTINLP